MNTAQTLYAVRAGYSAFRFALANPGEAVLRDAYAARLAQYRLGWSAYTNDAFSRLAQWEGYAAANGLYARTRGFKNPTGRIVDFYAGTIYQGVLSEDGANLPEGQPLAIPLGADTALALRAAIAQTWQWGNWQEEMSYWLVLCAAMGDGPIEVVDDCAAGRVYQRVLPPAFITDVEFNSRGDVVYYRLEYSYYQRATQRACTFRREVDKEVIRTWHDTEQAPQQQANPYGFVPLVWARHRKLGGNFGAPAIRCWDKVERLNSKLSRIDAYIRVQSQVPQVYIGSGKASALGIDGTRTGEGDVKVIQIEGEGKLVPFANNLDIESALADVRVLIDEIEADHPETTMYQKLSEMTALTGPAAARMLGNVEHYVQDARGRYDNQYRKLAQMLVAIGGFRYNEGREGWAAKTRAQQRFAPFGQHSYARGDLHFAVGPRPLVPATQLEREKARLAYYQRIRAGIDAGFPVPWQLAQDGSSPHEIAQYRTAVQADAAAAAAAAADHATGPAAPDAA